MNIATISAGFEKGDFLVREEQGNRVYFDFFEEVGFAALILVEVRRISFMCIPMAFSNILFHSKFGIFTTLNRPSTTSRTRDMLA